ncbi:MAG: amino acid ABC transporter permease [Inconstantimicrobium porci]|uniref:amino acid ABC transporter permease n=1 Tax=Inconstantimicrobium porci TaxID=2652291 RepID=UPI002A915808|nr:amino acid ABC transporter permease [Inconstantimicrobium porci]MDY5910883.1 amino acid ABC transporter permease [Inconstantimicrobium porci]
MGVDWGFVKDAIPLYEKAALLTLKIAFFGIVLSIIIGFLCSIILYFKVKILDKIVQAYIELSRNTPLLIQVFFLYFGFPKVGVKMSEITCAVIGLSFLGGSYMAEAFRSGLEAVSKSQIEGGISIGLSKTQLIRYVIIPQAIRRMLPGTINLATRMIKTTSLVVLIGVIDVVKVGQQIIETSRFQFPAASFWIYGFIFFLYFIICYPLSKISKVLEKKWS